MLQGPVARVVRMIGHQPNGSGVPSAANHLTKQVPSTSNALGHLRSDRMQRNTVRDHGDGKNYGIVISQLLVASKAED